jgi:hypothetical protein
MATTRCTSRLDTYLDPDTRNCQGAFAKPFLVYNWFRLDRLSLMHLRLANSCRSMGLRGCGRSLAGWPPRRRDWRRCGMDALDNVSCVDLLFAAEAQRAESGLLWLLRHGCR